MQASASASLLLTQLTVVCRASLSGVERDSRLSVGRASPRRRRRRGRTRSARAEKRRDSWPSPNYASASFLKSSNDRARDHFDPNARPTRVGKCAFSCLRSLSIFFSSPFSHFFLPEKKSNGCNAASEVIIIRCYHPSHNLDPYTYITMGPIRLTLACIPHMHSLCAQRRWDTCMCT